MIELPTDVVAAATAIREVLERSRRAEADRLALAAHWADLHPVDQGNDAGTGRALPGSARAVSAGGDGTPEVDEFAAAELGLLLETTTSAAAALMADAVNLRHRHPDAWIVVQTGRADAWKAVKVARACAAANLTEGQARWVDAGTTPHLGRMPVGRFLRLVDAKIIQADTVAAEARRLAAAVATYVRKQRVDEHGLQTLVARAAAGDIARFWAMTDRLAQILAQRGDADPVEVRRSKALGILATPAHALALLAWGASQPRDPVAPDDGIPRRWSSAPVDNAAPGEVARHYGTGDRPDSDTLQFLRSLGEHDDPDPPPEPAPPEAVTSTTDPPVVVIGADVDPAALLPEATLYVHIDRDSLTTRDGVARIEDVGAATLAQVKAWLGDTTVAVRPVLDLAGGMPTDAYQASARMREVVELRWPHEVFPFGTLSSRTSDLDHAIPYRAPDEGGPAGQTHPDGLGPLSRYHHRVRTHGDWTQLHPESGVHLWRCPAGHWARVDQKGTTYLGTTYLGTTAPAAACTASPLEQAMDLLLSA